MAKSMLRSTFAPVGLAGLWIATSEFLRNELWLKTIWTDHYANLGLNFPSDPVNGAIWVLWSFVFAICIRILLSRFTPVETIALSWGMGFGLMWLVTGNMSVLPLSILLYAVPLSLLEVGIAVVILHSLSKDRT